MADLLEQLDLTDVAETLQQGDHERALTRLLEEAEATDDADRKELLRRALVALFAELGQENPLVGGVSASPRQGVVLTWGR